VRVLPLTNEGVSSVNTPRSYAWYLLPIVLGLLGGVIAYFVLRKSDSKKAKICLIIGIGISVLWTAAVVNAGSSERDSPSPIRPPDEESVERVIPQSIEESTEQRIKNLKQEIFDKKIKLVETVAKVEEKYKQIGSLNGDTSLLSTEELENFQYTEPPILSESIEELEQEKAIIQGKLEEALTKYIELSKEHNFLVKQTIPPKVEPKQPSDDEFDPAIVASAKKNIPYMQSLPKEILKQCKNVKSLSDYIAFGLAVESKLDELVKGIGNIDEVLTVLEVKGYDKHPEVGPLIKKTRSLSIEVNECLNELQRRYGS